jgi:hypothetical protein
MLLFLGKLLMRVGVRDLFRREEVVVLANAVECMAFQVEQSFATYNFSYNGQVALRLDTRSRTLLLVGLSNTPTEVFRFRWWRMQDHVLYARLLTAIAFYERTVHKVRMQDYRAMFGKRVEEAIASLADLADRAEGEAKLLARVDAAGAAGRFHPDVQRLVQPLDTEPQQEDPTDGR